LLKNTILIYCKVCWCAPGLRPRVYMLSLTTPCYAAGEDLFCYVYAKAINFDYFDWNKTVNSILPLWSRILYYGRCWFLFCFNAL